MANKNDIAKAKQEAAEVIRVSEGSQRAVTCIQNLVDIINELEKDLHSTQNKSDFSGDMRVLKNKLETSKSEVLQYEKFRHNIMQIMTETVRVVGAAAGALAQNSGDPELVKTNSQKILVQIKDLVEKLSTFQKAG